MLVSKQLLSKFLPKIHGVDNKDIINACSAIGIEVEQIITHPVTDNLVIGQILEVTNHPNADKLHMCKVQINNKDVNTIVCGANNVVAGKKVIVALQNAKLHDGRVIEYKELRSILSQGMICAYSELTPHAAFQPDEDKDGIILLDDALVGDKDVGKYIGLNDTLFELTLPSNRNDLNGVLFLCQELSGYFKWDFQIPSAEETNPTFNETFNIEYDGHSCNGFAVVKIKDIKCHYSNWLTKGLLMNNGVKPINDVIDRLAYITLLTNAPTAIYDASKITNDFTIAKANSNDSFIGFDNNKYDLSINDIVVKSNNTIVSLGGIIGSADFGVTKQTKDVVVELANFNSTNIRNTLLKLNLNTDAARRFSKPISNYAIELAVSFIYKQFAGYQVSAPVAKLPKAPLVKVTVDLPYMQQLLGTALSLDSIKENLTAYGFIFDGDTCFVPLYRQDIATSQDISEEILKFLNINELLEMPIQYDLGKLNTNYESHLINQIKSILNGNFINEVKTYNLVSEQKLNTFNLYKYTTPIRIENSHNSERTYLRTNLINEMLKVYAYNASYKTSLQSIFEIQKIYGNENELNLTVLSLNTINLDYISKSKLNVNVNYLKAIANQIANLFGVKLEYLHTTETGVFYRNEELAIQHGGRLIGYIGLIKQTMLQPYSLHDKNIYCLSLNLTMLLNLYQPTKIKFSTVSKLQPVFKDVSFFINDGEKIENLLNALKSLPFIDSYQFIDRYVNNDGQVSYTIAFKFIADKTINTKTIDNYLNQIYQKMVESNCIVRK